MKKKILIFSAGSAGRDIYQLISTINKFHNEWEVIGYVDSDSKKIGKNFDDVKVYSNKNKPKNKEIFGICGIMNIKTRKKIFDNEIKNDYKLTNLIHPRTEIPKSLKIGNGNIIFNCNINANVKIKNFSVISQYCNLGDNTVIGNYTHMLAHISIGSHTEIGDSTFIASGVHINRGVKIGSNCMLGIGTVIMSNLKKNSIVMDYPRQVVRKNK